jgi:hypothetical protein
MIAAHCDKKVVESMKNYYLNQLGFENQAEVMQWGKLLFTDGLTR